VGKPTVTVVVDTFNHEHFIENALSSVLEQDCPKNEFEIIVVDDGSTDNTASVLRRFAGDLRVIAKQNGGQASAFNAAIPLARGELVSFLDGDDWWSREKLSIVLSAFSADPELGVVGHSFYEVDEIQKQVRAVVAEFDLVAIKEKADGIAFSSRMCFFGTSRVTIRKRILSSIGPLPEALVLEADEFMSTVAIAKSRARVLPQPLTFYRVHSGNMYYFREGDPQKIRRKRSVLVHLSKDLRNALGPEVLDQRVVDSLVAPIDLEASRLKLLLEKGWPWETFCIELAASRLAYSRTTWRFRIFRAFSLLLTLLLPPRTYYRIRRFYSEHNLKRFRKFTGEPTPVAKIKYYQADLK
jgi:glycosyltransferase involved in cell wall biosynthesis